jgi:hypothetical protein
MNLVNTLQQAAETTDGSQNGKLPPLPRGSDSNGTVVELTAAERERLLLTKITELRARLFLFFNQSHLSYRRSMWYSLSNCF